MPSKKQKGPQFEREVAKDLSLWISSGHDADIFWRSQASGARATKRGDTSLSHSAGDIAATKPAGELLTRRFFIECKWYFDLQLGKFLVNSPSKLGHFWRVAQEQASRYSREPVLIAKQNRYPAVIMMRPSSWQVFPMNSAVKTWGLMNAGVVVSLFREFLENASPEIVASRSRLAP